MQRIQIGDQEIIALSDGMSRLPPQFFPGLDTEVHPEVLDGDGTVHIPTGSFLVTGPGGTVLVDAGLGPTTVPFPVGLPVAHTMPMSEGGLLPEALAAAGHTPRDIDMVFLTHLHADHIGWVAPYGEPYLPRAEVVFGAADWEPLVEQAPAGDAGAAGMRIVRAAGLTRPLTEPTVPLAAGITARHAPGHTPGSYILTVCAGTDYAYLLGDVVQSPLQLTDAGIAFITDADAAVAAQTRETLFHQMQQRNAVIGMDHFPGGGFQRITNTSPRRWQPAC